jgi:phosphinothricin acetyltransferase
MDWTIRPAADTDAAAIAAIYAPIVEQTFISFEEIAPRPAEMAARINKLRFAFPWLVAELAGHVAGYAYAGPHRERASYRWSTDVSVYVDTRARGCGVARSLYRALFEILAAQGYCRAFAGISLPNDASEGLHRALGFERVGVYRQVGYKFGAWRDTLWCQRPLRDPDVSPAEPVPFAQLATSIVRSACAPTRV